MTGSASQRGRLYDSNQPKGQSIIRNELASSYCLVDVSQDGEIAGMGRRSLQSKVKRHEPADGWSVPAPLSGRELGRERVGELLGRWQTCELRSIRGCLECRDISIQQLEDLYQETVVTLLARRHNDEQHLRYALRAGIRMRALNAHRDEIRHEEILASNQPELRLIAHARDGLDRPERVALAREDRMIVWEFLTELTDQEKRIFWLLAEGMSYNRIARLLGLELNEARRAVRTCERKRERFGVLHSTGRLCGYRAATIHALQHGETTSQELARRAFAHLEACPRCRAEHKTTATRLRHSFQREAAALLPLPALAGHVGWIWRVGVRTKTVHYRGLVVWIKGAPGGLRDRAAVLLAGGGMTAKVGTGVATVAMIAGGTVGVTRLLDHEPSQHHRADLPGISSIPQAAVPFSRFAASPFVALTATHSNHTSDIVRYLRQATPGHVFSRNRPRRLIVQREPGGFAYLGVPTGARSSSPPETTHADGQTGGGPFSP
jgi:RNA polymerase sigma factor (sigma-70 family)